MQATTPRPTEYLKTLPGDDIRQLLWRFADRYDLQMLVQSVRAVARGPVARLVAQGGRLTHEWTPEKDSLLREFDAAGITSAFMEPEEGGFLEGPKNLALALIAFELAWVDAGAATGSMATHLGLSPIHERGTPEQKAHYMALAVPAPGKPPHRAAFALTEPLPFVGVETGMLSGKVRVVDWPEGGEPLLEVSKRGRFITNMGFANIVSAAVESDDPRIHGTCMVILEEGDPGLFDRGTPTRKLVHQLSSTRDPVFQLRVPASRIIGGYQVVKGKIVPNFDHGAVIEAVFRRTRVTVGIMSAAKLLSAIEPVIRYQRDRFRGSGLVAPGSPRYDLGLQQKEDATHRLVDVWAAGEASLVARLRRWRAPTTAWTRSNASRTPSSPSRASTAAWPLSRRCASATSTPSSSSTWPAGARLCATRRATRPWRTTRWCSTPGRRRARPTCSARRPSCGTPATARR